MARSGRRSSGVSHTRHSRSNRHGGRGIEPTLHGSPAFKNSMLAAALIVLLAAISPTRAGDISSEPPWRSWFPGFWTLSPSVWQSDACWRTCETHCGSHFEACIRLYAVNDCRKRSDHCDLACVKQCRTYGGPLLDWTD